MLKVLGHMLPGLYGLFLGTWWSFITAIRSAQSNLKSPFKKNTLVGYMSTATMPCICLPCGSLRRAPIESFLKLFVTFLCVLVEIIYGFRYEPKTMNHNATVNMSNINTASNMTDELILRFNFRNAHHSTIYLAFILGYIVEILIYYGFDLPKRLEYALSALAFGVEAFVFANHLHGREPLDVHLHTLLVYSVEGCIIFTCLEFIKPTEILFTYGRILCIILQGTWFCQIGFVMYPPTKSPAWQWDFNDHMQIMTITMVFCWHIILIVVFLLLQLWFIKRVYSSSKTLSNQWDELLIHDEKIVVISDGSFSRKNTKYISLLSGNEDSDDNNEDVTFENMTFFKNRPNYSNITPALSTENSNSDKSSV